MSDENEEAQENESEKAGEQTADSGGAGKTYAQAELDRMFAERARQAESSLLKKLGFEKADDALAALGKLKTIEDGQKSDLQKAQDKIAELTKSNADLSEKQKSQIAQYEVALAAGKLGIVDPDAAFRLLDKNQLTFDEKTGKPNNAEQVLKSLLTEKPWLTGGGTSAVNHARNRGDLSDDPVTMAARKAAGLPVDDKK